MNNREKSAEKRPGKIEPGQHAGKMDIDETPDQKRERNHQQELLDEGIEESFPASDPPSASHID